MKKAFWFFLVLISTLCILWYSNNNSSTNKQHGEPVLSNTVLQGYIRITPGNTMQFLDLHHRECALVSSSGQMLHAGKGPEIDRAEFVIRMNNAPTMGHERDVGSRTDMRVVSHTSVPLLLRNESYYFQHCSGTVYVVWGPERNMRQDGKGKIFNALLRVARKFPQVRIYTVSRMKVEYCDTLFQKETGKNRMESGAYLSTGFFTMVLALDMCDRVVVYGMISDKYCSQPGRKPVPYHYYEKARVDECRMYNAHERARRGGHRFITEKAIYAKWASQRRLHFQHPSWNQTQNVII